tara:strand:+ start:217 stop:714 length:498 start_codon:yes stop_codon:yes gene_type:complete
MTLEKPKIIPNFLSYYAFDDLTTAFTHNNFPWHYPQSEGEPEQYSHLLYYDHQFSRSISPQLMNALQIIITDKLNAIATLRVKINATPRNAPEQIWHQDWYISTPNKTCVLYLNDNDGYTEFRDGTKVDSVKNTAVIFDSNTEHRGVPATNVDRRLVLNINYFEK